MVIMFNLLRLGMKIYDEAINQTNESESVYELTQTPIEPLNPIPGPSSHIEINHPVNDKFILELSSRSASYELGYIESQPQSPLTYRCMSLSSFFEMKPVIIKNPQPISMDDITIEKIKKSVQPIKPFKEITSILSNPRMLKPKAPMAIQPIYPRNLTPEPIFEPIFEPILEPIPKPLPKPKSESKTEKITEQKPVQTPVIKPKNKPIPKQELNESSSSSLEWLSEPESSDSDDFEVRAEEISFNFLQNPDSD
ncbi:uncharacterized protein LOC142645658 [Dermatophagoides pteronyssinus]|uniref:uncharacterized protein LOC142645658 n=1 Tax=Dermatophagoides pteronyssinus TaxID=6956 RepID=UPI003F677469